jgi:hypothetical protein
MQAKYKTCVLQIRMYSMKRKRKRAPGGGRKPSGPFKHSAAQLTVRMPDDMRARLNAAAQKKGWSLSQELLWRLRVSFEKENYADHRDPATRALCFLIAEAAQRVHIGIPVEWHRDPFLFKAFKLAVAALLDALEPAGSVKSPLPEFSNVLKPHEMQLIGDRWKTPETAAAEAAKSTLNSLLLPTRLAGDVRTRLQGLNFPEWPNVSEELIKEFESEFYVMANARRDLGIDELKGSKS